MPAVVAAVALAGIGVGVAVADRDDTSTPAAATSNELADISQACTTWMNNDARWGPESSGCCQDMTGWMSQQMANGSMMGPMMWGDPDQMRGHDRHDPVLRAARGSVATFSPSVGVSRVHRRHDRTDPVGAQDAVGWLVAR